MSFLDYGSFVVLVRDKATLILLFQESHGEGGHCWITDEGPFQFLVVVVVVGICVSESCGCAFAHVPK